MQVFDLNSMKAKSYEQRDQNVFFEKPEFKTRIIELDAGGEMPDCEMESFVVFVVLEGKAKVRINDTEKSLGKGECLITDPAIISMKTDKGVKIMGIQINKKGD